MIEIKKREIRFREYHKTRKEIYPVSFINFDKKIVTLSIEKTINGEWYRTVTFDTIELIQHTGLKDNNDVDIYEGDIVEHLDGEYSFSGVVTYSPFGWFVRTEDDNISFEHFADELEGIANCTVIGSYAEN